MKKLAKIASIALITVALTGSALALLSADRPNGDTRFHEFGTTPVYIANVPGWGHWIEFTSTYTTVAIN
jgi:hypothetical protein